MTLTYDLGLLYRLRNCGEGGPTDATTPQVIARGSAHAGIAWERETPAGRGTVRRAAPGFPRGRLWRGRAGQRTTPDGGGTQARRGATAWRGAFCARAVRRCAFASRRVTARLVARAQRTTGPLAVIAAVPTSRWLAVAR